MNIKKMINKATDGLLNDDFRQSFLVGVLSIVLAIVSAIAAVTHFINDPEKFFAILMTLAFCFSSSVFFLTIFVNKYHGVWRRIFMGLIIIFFGYLCYDGGPDGFLHIWILLIPAFSFITFGLKEGFITSIPVFLSMVGFFWWPAADLRKFAAEQASFQIVDAQVATLSVNFRLRITIIYVVCLFVGFFAELVRYVAAKRLRSFTENFKYASLHDSLTGLANQNYLARYLDETYQNKTNNTTLGCLFVDIDCFKNVNDTYGHLFGNVVLVKVAEILAQQEGAFVCRWGGDEFVVCMADVKEEKLLEVGEKFRAAVSACVFKDYPKFHITVSVGAVVLPVDETFNFDHVLDLADYANRMAKSKGKNNVSLAKKIPN